MSEWFKRNLNKNKNEKNKNDADAEIDPTVQLQDIRLDIQSLKADLALSIQAEFDQTHVQLQQIKNQQQLYKEKLQAIRLDVDQLKVVQGEKTDRVLEKLYQLRMVSEASGSDRRENQSECKICMAGKIETCLIPCGHLFCKRCADRSKSSTGLGCPICRKSVSGVQNVFFP